MQIPRGIIVAIVQANAIVRIGEYEGRLFGGVQEGRVAIGDFHGDFVQGAIGFGTIVAARSSARIGQNLPNRDQAPPAFRTAAQAAIGIGSRTRTARILGGEGAGEVLVSQNAAGANDHRKKRSWVRSVQRLGLICTHAALLSMAVRNNRIVINQ
ncbi:hypothetical protein [Labrys miyagiensis]